MFSHDFTFSDDIIDPGFKMYEQILKFAVHKLRIPMNLVRILLLFLSFWSFAQISAQDKEFAKRIIAELSSAELHGRGYYENGVNRAADLIVDYLKDLKINPLNASFKQEFDFDINTFPKNLIVKIDDVELKPATDFFIEPNSGPAKGTFNVLRINDNLVDTISYLDSLKKLDLSSTFLVSGKSNNRNSNLFALNARGYIFTSKSLYWRLSGSNVQKKYTSLVISDSIIPLTAKTITVDIEPKFLSSFKNNNVLATIPAVEQSDSFMVFTAHYDHLGIMGPNCMFPGANDNASGVAMLLELGKYFSANPLQNYNIALMFFAAEEVGLYGSQHYVANPIFPLKNISCLINFDMVGTGSGGLAIVNGKANNRITSVIQNLNAEHQWFSDIRIGGASCSSDHCYFAKENVPAIFLFTRGEEHRFYHVPQDRAEILPLTKWHELQSLVITLSRQWEEN